MNVRTTERTKGNNNNNNNNQIDNDSTWNFDLIYLYALWSLFFIFMNLSTDCVCVCMCVSVSMACMCVSKLHHSWESEKRIVYLSILILFFFVRYSTIFYGLCGWKPINRMRYECTVHIAHTHTVHVNWRKIIIFATNMIIRGIVQSSVPMPGPGWTGQRQRQSPNVLRVWAKLTKNKRFDNYVRLCMICWTSVETNSIQVCIHIDMYP